MKRGSSPGRPAPSRRLAAWSVHLFTALGIVAALLALIAVAQERWREVFLWLFVALVIDGVDGSLARAVRVWEVLPGMDGKMIDTVVDFTTYAVIPAFFFYQAELAPPGWNLLCAALMLLAAALYYGKEGMVADSMHFVGFPVLWNIFIFYPFFVFNFPGWANAGLVVLFSVLHFVPLKFAYPSRTLRHRLPTLIVAVTGLLAAAVIIWGYPERYPVLNWVTVGVAGYFGVMAVADTLGKPKNRKTE